MFCRNCGISMEDTLKFCPKCGTPVDPDELHPNGCVATGLKKNISPDLEQQLFEQASAQISEQLAFQAAQQSSLEKTAGDEKEEPSKAKISPKMMILIGIGAVLGLILIIAGSIWVIRKTSRINLNDYVEDVDFTGYNTIGRANVDFDYESFYEDMRAKSKDVPEAMGEDYQAWMNSVLGIYIDVVEAEELSNGDQVTLTWEIDEDRLRDDYGIRFKYRDETYTVEDLEEAELVDIFEGVTVSFNGIEPYGCAYLNQQGEHDNIPMELVTNDGLSNGDMVEVRVSGVEDEATFADTYGFLPVGLSKEYEVTGLTSYIEELDQLPEDFVDQLKDQFSKYLEGYIEQNWSEKEILDSCVCVGQYFLTPETDNYSYNEKNVLYLVYQINLHVDGAKSDDKDNKNGTVTYYMYLRYDNVTSDGAVKLDNVKYSTRNFDSDVYSKSLFSDKQYYSFIGYESVDAFEEEILKAFEEEGYVYEESEEKSQIDVTVTVSYNGLEEED